MITILMSTYNSEHFLREQIDSILAQQEVECRLIVRDDGSTDSTWAILDEYQSKGQLTWYHDGRNLKPARAFMQMLKDAPESDYYAFADHDDVWLPEKMQAAEQALAAHRNSPALYYGQTQLVDAELHPLDKQIIIHPYCTLGEALINHFVGGCTMVMTRELRNLIVQYEPDYLSMHDIWIYLVAQAVDAKIIFDSTPHILYRQHGYNEVGQGYSVWHGMIRHYNRLIRNREHVRKRMAQEVLQGYGNKISAKNRQLIEMVAHYDQSFARRLAALHEPQLRCHNRRTWMLSKIAILCKTL